MAINSLSDYEKVINVSWFTPDRPTEELTWVYPVFLVCAADADCDDSFPCVLPFSQMYPLCCIDIRNFLNQFYFFLDDHFQHSDIIDETLRKVHIALPNFYLVA